MTIRRLVTGQRSGKAVVLSDGPVPTEHHFAALPGLMSAVVWSTASPPEVDVEEGAPVGGPDHPAPGHTVFSIVDFPPESVMAQPGFDPAALGAEQIQQSPEMTKRFEVDNPGMHTTDTVDYAIVLQGKIWLDLDDGEPTLLEAGDIVVQQRTRHAWRNFGSEIARMAFVLLGTDRVH